MNSKIEDIRTRVERLKGRQAQVETNLDAAKLKLRQAKVNFRRHEMAREIIREASLKIQQSLSYHISEITTLALDAVFEDPYSLEVDFVEKRNKTECELYFSRDDNEVDPLDGSGGGAVDVASFALRVASWSMQFPRHRNTIILDEPLKNLSAKMEYLEKGAQMLKEVSAKLGIQFIIVTHEPTLTMYADRVFEVSQVKKGKEKGISKITSS